jgi:hypothetical protein
MLSRFRCGGRPWRFQGRSSTLKLIFNHTIWRSGGEVKNQDNADIVWARRTASRYRDPEVLRGEIEEQAKLTETEKARAALTRDLWRKLLSCLKSKVRAFNVEWGEEFISCARSRDKFSVALPPFSPMPPFNVPAEPVRVSLKYNRKQLLFHLTHSDQPRSSVWALRPDIGSSCGNVEVCVVIGKRQVIPYMNMTVDDAAESLVECLLRVGPTAK